MVRQSAEKIIELSEEIATVEMMRPKEGLTILRGSGDSDGGVAADHRTSADPMPSTSTGVMENDGNRPEGGGVRCVCLCVQATHVFIPCGHLCVCVECLTNLKRKRCPVCRARYDMVVKTISA